MRRREFIAGAAALPIAAWHSLKETHAQQSDRVRSLSIEILRLSAEIAAATDRQFFKEIENQIAWTTQLLWSTGTIDQRKFDGSRVLRQGRFVVHPDSTFQSDFSGLAQVQAVLPASRTQGRGRPRYPWPRGAYRQCSSRTTRLVVFVEQPTAEIDAPAIRR